MFINFHPHFTQKNNEKSHPQRSWRGHWLAVPETPRVEHENLRTRGCLPWFPLDIPRCSCSQCTASPRTHTWPATDFLDFEKWKKSGKKVEPRDFLQKTLESWVLITNPKTSSACQAGLVSPRAFNLGRGTWGSLMVPAWQSDPTILPSI